jgi:HK97 family phage major capsid protein
MKTFIKQYPHLTVLAVVLVCTALLGLAGTPLLVCAAIIGLWQLSQLALSRPAGVCYETAVMTPEQIKEFGQILEGLKGYGPLFKDLEAIAKAEGGMEALKGLVNERKRVDGLETQVKKLEKKLLLRQGDTGVRYVNGKAFVTDDCALALAGLYLSCCLRQDKWDARKFGDAEVVMAKAADWVGVAKAALTSSDIPLPTIYVPQIIELVYKYGQFRQYATVFPLGAGTVNLPQLKPGEDAFGLIAMSGAVTERHIAAQNVTFTAQKVGGIIRVPTEIEEDTFIPLGQFLARYISRRFAAFEDAMGFLGDNSATYLRYGVGPYIAAAANTPQLLQLAAGKVRVTDATINNFRAIRGLVNAAVLQSESGSTPAYYMNPTMEQLLVSFNTLNQPLIYRPAQGNQPATLDGFPIRWVGVMQPYSNNAVPNAFLAVFGELSYWYLGERGSPRVESSREVYFATDEIGMRALERIDVEAMAPDAMSALQTAAQ